MSARWRSYTGALHLRTEHSGGDGNLEAALEAARRSQIDFLVICDRNTRGYAHENQEGWHKDVLVLCGEEVTTPEGSFLAFETREDIGETESLDEALQNVRGQVGSAVSLLHLPRRQGEKANYLPPGLDPSKADIVEVWSFMDEVLARTPPRTAMLSMRRPDKLIDRPPPGVLHTWDHELNSRMIPAIGGLNVQPNREPLFDWTTMFPYEVAFGTIVTCIIGPDLPLISIRARDMVWDALRQGRSYIVNRVIGPEKGFAFEYRTPHDRIHHMGDEAEYVMGGKLHLAVPDTAEVVVRHNGQPLFWGTADEIEFPAPFPGSYRMEVYLDRRLWMLSNPIRLIDDAGILQPTVSDVT